MKKIRRNEIEIVNKEYFLENYKKMAEENHMKSILMQNQSEASLLLLKKEAATNI